MQKKVVGYWQEMVFNRLEENRNSIRSLLLTGGISKEMIRKYAFAFEGEKVLIADAAVQ